MNSHYLILNCDLQLNYKPYTKRCHFLATNDFVTALTFKSNKLSHFGVVGW